MVVPPPMKCPYAPILSSQNLGWEPILVEQFQNPSGEGYIHYRDEHTICLSLAQRPVNLLQIKGSKRYQSLYGKGDTSITPAQVPFFARWEGEDRYLQIRIAAPFIQQVAQEAFELNPEQVEILPEFRMRDSQIEAIALMLLAELQQAHSGSRLYVESLANVLAVHLLRQYATSQIKPLTCYRSGLPERQLTHVLDYIQEHLDQEIRLSDLANLVGISRFHFSHLFKQSLGVSPYQYLLRQRIEQVKRLLKQTDLSILEIALTCGFSSHSHLGKQFRQLTGMTPKAYRMS